MWTVVALVGLGCMFTGAGTRAADEPPGRVVAIGDIHGAYDGLVSILRATDLIDEANQWTGGTTSIVQTGDIVDRGPDVRKVLDLLMDLERQAPEHGGNVLVLMGNHEAMTLLRDYQDATPEIFATFADEGSEKLREHAFKEWRERLAEMARTRGGAAPELTPDKKEQWMKEHPLGYFEYQEAFGPEGKYGRWLLERPVVVKVGNVLFQHAGLNPKWAKSDLDKINENHRKQLEIFFEDQKALAKAGVVPYFFDLYETNSALVFQAKNPPQSRFSNTKATRLIQKAADDLEAIQEILWEDSPLWFRGYTNLSDDELEELLEALEKRYGTHHFVAAHSPLETGRIEERLDGRVFLIDTGMLQSYYGGRPSALEIVDGKFTAIYADEQRVLLNNESDTIPAATSSRPVSAVDAGPLAMPAVQYSHVFRQVALAATGESAPERRWLDPSGDPLLFEDHAEITDFLRSASVLSIKDIPEGVTKPREVLLELDGVRARAAFRYVSKKSASERLADGSIEKHFRDDYRNEVAAYELSRLLGMNVVPPAVLREVEGTPGSIQLWIEGAITLKNFNKENPGKADPTARSRYLKRQVRDMNIFDNLIRNIDRNQGNIMWDPDMNLWLIDHTRSFSGDDTLPFPDDVVKCSRRLWSALQNVDPKQVKSTLSPYLGGLEIKALLRRHKKLVDLLEYKIQEEGEEAVLFTYGDQPSPATGAVGGATAASI
ncbi:MAG: metallophosphoesterase [Thermoanaerobaculia bacterium]